MTTDSYPFRFQEVLENSEIPNPFLKVPINWYMKEAIKDLFINRLHASVKYEGKGQSMFLMGEDDFSEVLGMTLVGGGLGYGQGKMSDVRLSDLDETTYEVKFCTGVLRKECKDCETPYSRLRKNCPNCGVDGSGYRSGGGASFQKIPDRDKDDGVILIAPTFIDVEYGSIYEHKVFPGRSPERIEVASDITVVFDIWMIDTSDEFFRRLVRHERRLNNSDSVSIDLSFRGPQFWSCGPIEMARIEVNVWGLPEDGGVRRAYTRDGNEFGYDINFLSLTPFNTKKRGIRFDAIPARDDIGLSRKYIRHWAEDNLPEPKHHSISWQDCNVSYTRSNTPHVIDLVLKEVRRGHIDKDDLFIDREECEAYQHELDRLEE